MVGLEFNLQNSHKNAEPHSAILPKHGLLVDTVSNLPRFKEGWLTPHFSGGAASKNWLLV